MDLMEGKESIEHKAYARIGLLGNPSDVYNGRTISFGLANFWAIARLRSSKHLVIEPHSYHDLIKFDCLEHLVNRVQNEGYYGGARLLLSTCKTFFKYCEEHKIQLHDGKFTLSYDTNIPRQTGLSGSSAIVCASLNCLLDFYGVRHLVKVEDRPNLILSAEGELGITAGLQDRVAQVYGGLVYMDFNKEFMEKNKHGIYIPMDVNLLPQMHLIYAENPSDSGKIHSTVRERWLNGEEEVRKCMEEVATLPLEGRDALMRRDYDKLAELMNRNFDLRRRMFGDAALGTLNIKMVEVARSIGAAAKFTGSGGAVVVFCPKGPSQVRQLEDVCQKAGLIMQPALVVPPLLTEVDLQTLTDAK
eukprot:TRINITY_DN1413_c0_g2_i1.p1 TRINITY_DN1413_c0_g2~~TRINITY_DN1413_c0_g2_i1.p1  ORF type:complete len:360 (-),score=62.91 TRINITY_DN1413_c0_g2_i1:275-1354(-)